MTVHREGPAQGLCQGLATRRAARPVSMPSELNKLNGSSPLNSPGTPPSSSLGSLDSSLASLASDSVGDWDLDAEDYAGTTGCWGQVRSVKSISPMLSSPTQAPPGRWVPLEDADHDRSPPQSSRAPHPPPPASSGVATLKRPTFLNLRRSATNTMSAQKYSKLPTGSATVRLRRVSEWLGK